MPRPALDNDQLVALRERVAKAVVQITGKDGPGGVTMRALGNEVGLSPMGLYRYFPGGKSEMIAAARAAGFRELARELEAVAAAPEPPDERVRQLATTAARFALEQPARYRLMFDLTQPADTAPGSEIATARRRAWRPVRHVFEEATSHGGLAGDPEDISHLFVAAVHGAIAFELSEQPYRQRRLDQVLPALVETLIRGFVAEPRQE